MRRGPSLLPILAAACLSLVLAACSSAGGSATGSPGAAGSGTACGKAPGAGDAPGWAPPATPPPVIPQIIANPGELVCGDNRMLVALLDPSGRPIAAPDRSLKIAIYDLGRDANKPIATADGTFVWAIENERGLYVVPKVSFPEAGTYGAEISTAQGGTTATVRLTFDVQASSAVVKVGDKAPASKTPTAADVGGDASKISTDPKPDAAFYQLSVDQAIAQHKPFVLVFATPKFCTSAQCGPTLDDVKPFVSKYPSVAFIHVEPYKLKYENGQLNADTDAQGQLQPTDVTTQWGLQSEPWVYVVDRNGVVRASFELIFSTAELTSALDSVK